MAFFVKKWTFPRCSVHYVQYQYFLFYILLIRRMRTYPTHPPAYGPGLTHPLSKISGYTTVVDCLPASTDVYRRQQAACSVHGNVHFRACDAFTVLRRVLDPALPRSTVLSVGRRDCQHWM